MMLRATLLVALLLLTCIVCCASAATVAVGVSPATASEDRAQADALLPLVELALGQRDDVQVVDRQQAKALIAELARSRALGDGIKTGAFAAADLLVSLEFPLLGEDDAAGESESRLVLARVIEGRTAVVRGVVVAPISAARIEDAAREIADYVDSHTREASRDAPTIAVLPFESVDRFDRVRPLERGLRDLLATELLTHGECRVVQRSDMGQLLSELELTRAGLAEAGQSPDPAQARRATYVLRGQVDSRTEGDKLRVLVNAELVDAATQAIVVQIEEKCSPRGTPGLVARLASEVLDQVASGRTPGAADGVSPRQTADTLLTVALRDVYRFVRISPDDDGYRPLWIHGVARPNPFPVRVKADTSLGRHLLLKSIDRLESALFIDPSRTDVALALGYCLSFHVDGVFQPERCERLLRRVLHESPHLRNRKMALNWLADRYFPHRGGFHQPEHVNTIDPQLLREGFESRLEAFRTAPAELRDTHWVRLLRMVERICETGRERDQCRRALNAAVEALDRQTDPPLTAKVRDSLAWQTASLAYQISWGREGSEEVRQLGQTLLREWLVHADARRRLLAARHLRYLRKITKSEHAEVIEAVLDDAPEVLDGEKSVKLKVLLAGIYRKRGQPEKALQLLKTCRPPESSWRDWSYAEYGEELGLCYEELGKNQQALETYLHFAETAYGLTYSSDVLERIEALGGVPLNPDRDIDVRYVDGSDGRRIVVKSIATDGRRLYYAGGARRARLAVGDSYSNRRLEPIPDVKSYNPATGEWRNLGGPRGAVRRLVVANGALWAAATDGLWRMTLDNREWRHWGRDDGLPAEAVVAVAVKGKTAYLGVGNLDEKGGILSGGAVKLTPGETGQEIRVYRGSNAPKNAPSHLFVDGDRLLACARGRIKQLDLEKDEWRPLGQRTNLFSRGESGIWLTRSHSEVSLLGLSREENKRFRAAWYPHHNRSGYSVTFMIEKEGQLWIGGSHPWHRFGSSGFYRLDLTSGEFHRYGPRDGFRHTKTQSSASHDCTGGVWLNGSLWLATSFGLAEVTPR